MKKILSMIIAAAMLLMLAACGGTGTPRATVRTLCEGMKDFDYKKIAGIIEEGDESAFAEIEEDSLFSALSKYLKEWASAMKYKIGKAEVSGDTATVKVDFTYTDASDVMTLAVVNYVRQGLSMAVSGASEDEMIALLVSCFESAAQTVSPGTAEKSVTLTLVKKDASWKIKDAPDEIADILTSNMISAVQNAFTN